ncbi:MAG: acetyl-CoA C-acyltransferase [Myxococcales bacterium]|nr:acetyl-CoA C-acyltransferase [Myxococcales bacterium]MCB9646680.1 acetyl-CoA C-acyltransferase [Deltaproteobacteria bacterium]
MRDVYILDAVRTPVGRHRGGLAPVRTDDLLAVAIKAALDRTGISGAAVDEVVMGCANQAGEDNRNVARMALLLAGMPNSVPGFTVNRLCASGLTAINTAARQIAMGDADIVLAGGVENMSRAPLVVEKGDSAFGSGNRTMYDTALGWRFPNKRMQELFPLEGMGETAENLAEQMSITREDQDAFALASHTKALAAETAGRFEDERVPVVIPQKKGDPVVVKVDEGPRADSSLEALGKLKPVFRKGGSVTAGNSSPLNDGAACVVLVSGDALRNMGREPMARWVASQSAGVNPRIMGIGPVPAVEKLLSRRKLHLDDVDLFELNEAFAAQSLAVLRRLDMEDLMDRVNVNGGAIALGHPLGCSGARLVTTLVHEMKRRGAKRGLATLCVGVGQGVASMLERD